MRKRNHKHKHNLDIEYIVDAFFNGVLIILPVLLVEMAVLDFIFN